MGPLSGTSVGSGGGNESVGVGDLDRDRATVLRNGPIDLDNVGLGDLVTGIIVKLAVTLLVWLADAVGTGVIDTVGLDDAEQEGDMDTVADLEGVADRERVADIEGVGDRDRVADRDGVEDGVGLLLALGVLVGGGGMSMYPE